MKIATTIAEVLPYVEQDPVRAVKCYEDSGFRYLDYSFYHMLNLPNHPLMGENWKEVILAVKQTAGFPISPRQRGLFCRKQAFFGGLDPRHGAIRRKRSFGKQL